MKNTHCQSCGAPVALNKSCCPYCDTPYSKGPVVIRLDEAAFCQVIGPLPNLVPGSGGNGGHAGGGGRVVAYNLYGDSVLEIEE